MKSLIVVVIVIVSYTCSIAQSAPVLGGVSASGIDMNTSIGGFISEISSNEVIEKGSVYLFDNWMPSLVSVQGKEFRNIKINYNLQLNSFEFQNGDKILRVASKNIDFVKDAAGNLYFETRHLKKSDGSAIVGICKGSTTEKWSIVTHYRLNVIEPNYIPSLDVGEKERTFSKKTEFYILNDSILYEVIGNRKKFSAQFPENAELIFKYIKENSIDLKDQRSLEVLVDYLNEL